MDWANATSALVSDPQSNWRATGRRPAAILAESTLSFIGIGINDPYSAWGTSWGTLAQDGYRAMRSYPHVIAFPAAAIFVTILCFNVFGNGLRDLLDPKQR